jgi:hypothetical protein
MERAMTIVERAYLETVDAMTPAERIQRSIQMFQWARQAIARQVVSERGPLPPDLLKCHIALRMYGADPESRRLIQEHLARVSSRGV